MNPRTSLSRRGALVFCVALALATPTAALAHHSPSKYNLTQVVNVTGVLTKLEWANPHVYLHIEETTSEGKVSWEIEGFPPSLMRRMGWARDTVRIGEQLTLRGNPGKNPRHKELFPHVIKRGGEALFVLTNATKDATQQAATGVAAKAKSLAGVWSTALDMKIFAQAASPATAALTPQGVQARKRFDEDTSPTSNCIPTPAPISMITPELRRVTVDRDAIHIESETGTGRTIHMNVTTHEGALPSLQGHSIGRWEGRTLVIDTARFAYHGTGNGGGNGLSAGVPSSTRKHLEEKLTLDPNGTSLTYEFVLTDPEFLATPRRGAVQWSFVPQQKFEVEACNLDISRRYIKK